EYRNVLLADSIISPSKALAEKISRDWKISSKRIDIIPNPYIPSKALLNIPVGLEHGRITFTGMLSILKGMVDFKEVISTVVSVYPDIKFRFIGEDSFSPQPDKTMKEFILDSCRAFINNIEFTGKVP